MREIKAPNQIDIKRSEFSVFLAGSIDNGAATNWQEQLVEMLRDVKDLVLLNPRRTDWNTSLTPELITPEFREQVSWEKLGMDSAHIVVFVITAKSISPITLLELGLLAGSDSSRAIVLCETGYFRKGNVDFVCETENIPQVSSLMELKKMITETMWGA